MNNISSLLDVDYISTKKHFWKNMGYTLMLAGLLNVSNFANAQTNTSTIGNKDNIEVVDGKMNKGLNLPKVYKDKINDMLINHPAFMDNGYNDTRMFTIDFVLKEMESDRWISKDNQLLFIRESIYQEVVKKELYDGEDGDEKRLQEFENALDYIDACWLRYRRAFMAYMDKLSKETAQHNAEMLQRKTELRQDNIRWTNKWLDQLLDFYRLYNNNPSSVRPEELMQTKDYSKRVIQNCKKYNIDYKAKLPKEVRDFYGIE